MGFGMGSVTECGWCWYLPKSWCQGLLLRLLVYCSGLLKIWERACHKFTYFQCFPWRNFLLVLLCMYKANTGNVFESSPAQPQACSGA